MLCIIVIILTLFMHLVFLYVFDYLLVLFFFSFVTCVLQIYLELVFLESLKNRE